MSFILTPSARETFTPRELADAYKRFNERGQQCVNAETGLRREAYWFGTRVLLVYEDSEMGVVVFIHPSAWKADSANFALTAFCEVGQESCNKYCN
jgi:hypothetical protein